MTLKAANAPVTIESLISLVKSYNPACDEAFLRRAYEVAEKAHRKQKRDSGEPYIMHPLAVANILAELDQDDATIAAGLLHDVVEDTVITLKDMREQFGEEVAVLVDGVTKLNKLQYHSKQEHQAESLRKMFLAMARDVRIIIIKLADRLHNMRTLGSHHSELRQKEIALETKEIFAPLAHRLGIYKIKWELEDLALAYLEPEQYKNLVQAISMKRQEREAYVIDLCRTLQQHLEDVGIKCEISGRPKNFYSIYNKMLKQKKDISEIYDIHAIRVIVDTVKDCYGALGVVHTAWKPIPGRFRDYIAMPKDNMYQSIHTTVIGPNGQPFEVQIRTHEMHRIAEYGIAAHWRYKEGTKATDDDFRLSWLRQMLEWQKEMKDAKEFVESVKFDLFQESVFVFSPRGDVYELPYGATPLDFAYRVHTQVGHQCVGAKVNDRIVPLDYVLQNGNIVEILTARGSSPSRDWVKIVKTSQARNKIRSWFRKEGRDENLLQRGRDMLEKECIRRGIDAAVLLKQDKLHEVAKCCGHYNVDDLLAAIAEGSITPMGLLAKVKEDPQVKKGLFPEEAEQPETSIKRTLKPFAGKASRDKGVWVNGQTDVMVIMAKCCAPVPGDKIVGYVTRGRGVSIHRADCPNIEYYRTRESSRLTDVRWDAESEDMFQTEILVTCNDRSRLFMDVIAAVSETKTLINEANVKVDDNKITTMTLTLAIKNLDQLEYIINKVRRVKSVIDVQRVLQK